MMSAKKKNEKASKFKNISKGEGVKVAEISEGAWVWFEDDDFVCVPVELVRINKDTVTVRMFDDGQSPPLYTEELVPVAIDEIKECSSADSSHLMGVDNMIHLGDFHLGAILHNIKIRMRKNLIYTHIGNILVAVNPYEPLPLYSLDMVSKYANEAKRSTKDDQMGVDTSGSQLPPHIYQIAKAAYSEMIETGKNQSIVISGESGSGKTESTKFILQYLTEATKNGDLNIIEKQILESNPILESFGNATTLRNNNSSRFGKWTEIYFDVNGRINGCKITNYLLEKVRVVRPTKGERNYHIFYYLCAGAEKDEKLRDLLKLKPASHYKYLNSNECLLKVKSIDDEAEFQKVLKAMETFNMTESNRTDLLKTLAGVLHLGNVEFEEGSKGNDDSSKINDSNGEFSVVCELLGWNKESAEKTLCSRIIGAGSLTEVVKSRTVNEAKQARDGLSKIIYEQLFNWIVRKLNEIIDSSKDKEGNEDNSRTHSHLNKTHARRSSTGTTSGLRFIGVLDIFGFEVFEKNSFEQMCINYANEKLQQHFNRYIFKEEHKAAIQENIDFAGVKFEDNQHTIDLFEESDGIFQLLDQTLLMSGDDQTFLNNVNNIQKENKNKYQSFFSPKTAPNSFGVNHYAGEVVYNVNDFIEKNKDMVDVELVVLLRSGNSFLLEIFDSQEFRQVAASAAIASSSSSSSQKRRQLQGVSLGKRYQTQLRDLMTIIEGTNPHFIRCIKPNSFKAPKEIEPLLTTQQLKYAGFLEAIRIRRLGYPVRRTFKAFIQRYHLITPLSLNIQSAVNLSLNTLKEACLSILEAVKNLPIGPPNGAQLGIQRIFLKQEHVLLLENARQEAIKDKVQTLQNHFRRFHAKKGFPEKLSLHKKIRKALFLNEKRDFDEMKNLEKELSSVRLENALTRQLIQNIQDSDKVIKKILQFKQECDETGLKEFINKANELKLNTKILDEAVVFLNNLEKAKADLSVALDKQSLDLLENCLRLCKDLNFSNSKVEEAKAIRDRLKKEMPLEETLKRSIASQRIGDLQSALNEAVNIGYQSGIVDEAKLLLTKLMKREEIKNGILNGLSTRDLHSLEKYLTEANSLGMGEDKTVIRAEEEIVPLRKEYKIKEKLTQAIKSRDLDQLENAIKEAEKEKVLCEQLREAKDLYENILTTTGVGEELENAINSRDTSLLQHAISKAKSLNLHQNEKVIKAEKVLESVIQRETCLNNLKRALELMSIEEITKAIKQAKQFHIRDEEIESAEIFLENITNVVQSLKESMEYRKLSEIQSALSKARNLKLFGHPMFVEAEKLEIQLEKEAWALNQLKIALAQRSLELITQTIKACRMNGISDDCPELQRATEVCIEISEENRAKVEVLTSSLESKENEVRVTQQKLEYTNEKLVEMEKNRNELHNKVEELTKNLQDSSFQLRERTFDLQKTQALAQESSTENSNLRAELKSKDDELRTVLSKLVIAEQNLSETKNQLERNQTHLSESEKKLETTHSQLQEKTQHFQELDIQFKAQTNSLNALEKDLESKKSEIEKLTEKLRASEEENSKLNRQNEQLNKIKEESSNTIKENTFTIKQLESQLSKARELDVESQKSQAKLQGDVYKQILELQNQLVISDMQKEGISQRLAISQERIQEITKEKNDMHEAKMNVEEKLRNETNLIQQLQHKIIEAETKNITAQAQINQLTIDLTNERQNLTQAKEKIVQLEKEKEGLLSRIKDVEKQLSDEITKSAQLTTKLEYAEQQNRDLSSNNTSLSSKVSELNFEIENTKNRLELSTEKNTNLEEDIKRLKLDIVSWKDKNQEALNSLQELTLKHESLVREASEKQNHLEIQIKRKQSEIDNQILEFHIANQKINEIERECDMVKQTLAEKVHEEQKIKDSAVVIQGWLKKVGGGFGTVRKRFFVLKANCLFYYESADPAEKPLGVVPLLGVDVRSIGKKKDGYALEIIPSSESGKVVTSKRKASSAAMVQGSHTSFILYAETEKNHDEWVSLIKQSVDENQAKPAIPPRTLKVPT